MRITAPVIDERQPQPYVGVAAAPTMDELPDTIAAGLDETFGWLGAGGLEPAGPPFVRFNVIDMDVRLHVEVGVPVEAPVDTDDLLVGELPGGRFASLVYTGVGNGVEASAALMTWASEHGLRWDRWDHPDGDAFACRVEWLLDGPDDDPDPANWRTEVAIRLA